MVEELPIEHDIGYIPQKYTGQLEELSGCQLWVKGKCIYCELPYSKEIKKEQNHTKLYYYFCSDEHALLYYEQILAPQYNKELEEKRNEFRRIEETYLNARCVICSISQRELMKLNPTPKDERDPTPWFHNMNYHHLYGTNYDRVVPLCYKCHYEVHAYLSDLGRLIERLVLSGEQIDIKKVVFGWGKLKTLGELKINDRELRKITNRARKREAQRTGQAA